MGISRDSYHKRRATGGKRHTVLKKRKFLIGRQPANTKLALQTSKKQQATVVHRVRGRGGNIKFRALRLHSGNFSWGTECTTHKCRILDVVYNASNNELVRTKTLVKNCVVEVDAAPFRKWYEKHYGFKVAEKGAAPLADPEIKGSQSLMKKLEKRRKAHQPSQDMLDQFLNNRVLACISSRPGQSGRADGYLLEGEEYIFYLKKINQK